MIRRVRIIYNQKNNTVKGSSLTIRDWVRYKVNESPENIVYKDEFSTIFCRNRENRVFIVYAYTHRNAQKALRKYFNNPLISEADYEKAQSI